MDHTEIAKYCQNNHIDLLYSLNESNNLVYFSKQLDITDDFIEKTKKDIILSTVQAYINVYDAQNTLDVYTVSKKALDKNYEIQKEKYKLRLVTRPNC